MSVGYSIDILHSFWCSIYLQWNVVGILLSSHVHVCWERGRQPSGIVLIIVRALLEVAEFRGGAGAAP